MNHPIVKSIDVLASGILIAFQSTVMLHQLFFGLQSAGDPRLLEAIAGMLAGFIAVACIAASCSKFSSVLYPARSITLLLLACTGIASQVVAFPFFLAIQFAALVAAISSCWMHVLRQEFHDKPKNGLSLAIVAACTMLAGGLWASRENFFFWQPLFVITVDAVLVAVHVVLVFMHLLGRPLPADAGSNPASVLPARKAPGVTAVLALVLGCVAGLYMSIVKLIAENTSVDHPTLVVHLIHACIASVVIGWNVRGNSDRVQSMKDKTCRFVQTPAGLLAIVLLACLSVAFPWIAGTTRLVSDTTAGTMHIMAVATVPVLVYFILGRLARIKPTGGYLAISSGFFTLGLAIGIAGYLFGGNTYNMDFYIGTAFSAFLCTGLVVAWAFKGHGGAGMITTGNGRASRGETVTGVA